MNAQCIAAVMNIVFLYTTMSTMQISINMEYLQD